MRALLLSSLAIAVPAWAGIWSPPMFVPILHPDGSKTWTITIGLRDIPKEDRALPAHALHEKLAGSFLAFHKFCPSQWEITGSRTEKKQLVVEGRCLTPEPAP